MENLEWNGFKSNSKEGNDFILGMMDHSRQMKVSREIFFNLIKTWGVSAWHIHDGYFNRNGKHMETANNLTWVPEHAGYSHSDWMPGIGEKIAIVKDSPDGGRKQPFSVWLYEVTAKGQSVFHFVEIKFIEKRIVVFTDTDCREYKHVAKHKNFLQKLFKK